MSPPLCWPRAAGRIFTFEGLPLRRDRILASPFRPARRHGPGLLADARRPLRRAPEEGCRWRVPARPRGELGDGRRRHVAVPAEERRPFPRRASVRGRGRGVHVPQPPRGRVPERQEGAAPDHRVDRDALAPRRRLPAEAAVRVVPAPAPPRHPAPRDDAARGRYEADWHRPVAVRGGAGGRPRRLRALPRGRGRRREARAARAARRSRRHDAGARAPERLAGSLAQQPSARPPSAPRREPAPRGHDPARLDVRVPRVQLPRSRARQSAGAPGARPRARPRRDRARPVPRHGRADRDAPPAGALGAPRRAAGARARPSRRAPSPRRGGLPRPRRRPAAAHARVQDVHRRDLDPAGDGDRGAVAGGGCRDEDPVERLRDVLPGRREGKLPALLAALAGHRRPRPLPRGLPLDVRPAEGLEPRVLRGSRRRPLDRGGAPHRRPRKAQGASTATSSAARPSRSPTSRSTR